VHAKRKQRVHRLQIGFECDRIVDAAIRQRLLNPLGLTQIRREVYAGELLIERILEVQPRHGWSSIGASFMLGQSR